MNQKLLKLVTYILFFFVITYFLFQIFGYFYGPYKTEPALEYIVSDYILSDGIFIRNEEVISYENSGIVDYLYENSEKVSKDTVVAKVYKSRDDIFNENLIKDIDKEIEIIKTSQERADDVSVNIDLFSKEIDQKYIDLFESISNNNISNIYNIRQDILSLKVKKNIALGEHFDFNSRINILNNYKLDLESKLVSKPDSVNSTTSGFFVNKFDGYESYIDENFLNDISVDKLNSVLNQKMEVPSGKIGKIIKDSISKFSCVVDDKDVSKFYIGQRLDVLFPSVNNYKVQMIVDDIIYQKDSNQQVLIMTTDIVSKEIVTIRKEKVQISFSNNVGIKIPKNVVRIKDGQKYVPILLNKEVSNKKIDVVYENDQYVLSKITDDKDYLQLFDDIIVRGKDLYD